MRSLMLREKLKLKAFEKASQGEYFDPREMRLGSGANFTMRNLLVLTFHRIKVIKYFKLERAGNVASIGEHKECFQNLR